MPALNIDVSPSLTVKVRWAMGHPDKPIACGLSQGGLDGVVTSTIDDPAATVGQVLAVLTKLNEERSELLEKIGVLDRRAADLGIVLDGLLRLMRERGILKSTTGEDA